ncbi:MAG: ATP synthase F1 subunit gamma [Candidatus Omnitrophica bacterium]|nr:ATP synthase F1 subunit gamma [Candidatus Omnitrophota bacterium]
MSQQLRQLKGRIRSIEGTWKITRAMEMVAMSKFKALETPLDMTRAYFAKLESIALNLIRVQEGIATHPFLRKNTANGPLGLLVVGSEAGLCGIYNDHLFKAADDFLDGHRGRDIKVYTLGRKAVTHYRKAGLAPVRAFPGFHGRLKADFHAPIYRFLEEEFLQGRISELHVAYTIFENAMKHHPVVRKLVSIDVPPGGETNFIIESGNQGIGSDVLPMYVSNRLRLMLMESFTSEHSARMVAMKAAKDNAKELMGDLVLMRNKMRQAMITKEVIEIISSAEALKG